MVLLELSTIIIALIALAVIYFFFKTFKSLIVNAIVGLVILFGANMLFGLSIAYSWLVILISAIGGALGALLIIVLHVLGIAF
ncbi:pro-sigmaK processing inhibitor BofA family protein [Methanohalobium sp.]|uniref:pro-sigmaK processing inhibitor BofA family protein n=1 Tax=Methanohalobium sp. TaxID=2837493 RepID=UPI0025F9969B|nr:pro-sigmaK processing inhibitor BofA family protein [Methanohalobium sp.]